MKSYVWMAACVLALVGCQRRDNVSSQGQSSGPSYSSTRTNTKSSQPETGTMAQNRNNRVDQSAAGTPGGQPTEVGSQRATQQAQTQANTTSDDALVVSIRESFGSGFGGVPAQTLKDIKITAANGRVTLKGTVSSEEERQRIEKQAQQIYGVKSVDNQLTVRGQEGEAIKPESKQGQNPATDQRNP